jgi:copper chaperone CopZ
MVTKLLAGLAAAAAVAVTGLAWAGSGRPCCAPGADCCFPGSPCCTDCCAPGAACCTPGSPCCAEPAPPADAPADDAKPIELPKGAAKAGCKCCAAGDGKGEKAADKPATPDATAVVLTVDGMTCAGCAKAVSKALAAVEGVEAVSVDVKAKTATVTPKAGKTPSPKDLWEAVEKAEYKPTKLAGPAGSFDKKPAK